MKYKISSLIWLIFIILIIFLSVSLLTWFKDPPVWPDEAIYANMAENFLNTGVIKTSLFHGAIFGLEQQANWYPPVFFYSLAGWFRFFGSSIESVRAFSITLAGIFLITTFINIKKLFSSDKLAFLGVILVMSDYSFFRASHFGRMEILVLVFLAGTLLSLLYSSKSQYFYILAGILASLALLTHPQGILAMAMIVLYIWVNQQTLRNKLTMVIISLLPFLMIIGLWLSSISLSLMWTQINSQLGRKFLEPLFLLVNLQQNFIWVIIIFIYIILWLMTLRLGIFFKNRFNLFLALLILLITSAISVGKEGWYIIYFQPFFAITLISLLKNRTTKTQPTLIMLVTILLVGNWILTAQNWQKWGSSSERYHQFTAQINAKLPLNGHVLLSSIPDPYFDLRNGQRELLEFVPIPVSEQSHRLLLDNADFVVINMIPNLYLKDYIEKYTLESIVVKDDNGYQAQIIKLVPQEKRI